MRNAPATGGSTWNINGLGSTGDGDALDGTLDEVKVWNLTLTGAQIRTLFENRTDIITKSLSRANETYFFTTTAHDRADESRS